MSTPAPWHVPQDDLDLFDVGEYCPIYIVDQHGFVIAQANYHCILDRWQEKHPEYEHWADGEDDGVTAKCLSPEEVIANAHLIAASQDLFNALNKASLVVDVVMAHLSDDQKQRLAIDLQNRGLADHEHLRNAAIAKATGRQEISDV